MAEFPALPLWTDAYLGDTTHLTTIEHGAYLLLLMTAWRTADCSLPDDDRLLARYARLNAQQWKRMRPIIEAFFTVSGGKWRQGRLTDERGAVERHRLQQSQKGKKGVEAKSLKRQARAEAAAKTGLPPAEAEVKPDASSHLHTHSSVDKSTGVPPVDPVKMIFDMGLAMLAEQGHGEKQARSLIGSWRKGRQDSDVIAALVDAQNRSVSNLVEWMPKRLNSRGWTNGGASSGSSIVDQVLAEKEREERRKVAAGGSC